MYLYLFDYLFICRIFSLLNCFIHLFICLYASFFIYLYIYSIIKTLTHLFSFYSLNYSYYHQIDVQKEILQSVEVEFAIHLCKKECSLALQYDSSLDNSKEILKSAEKYETALRGEHYLVSCIIFYLIVFFSVNCAIKSHIYWNLIYFISS